MKRIFTILLVLSIVFCIKQSYDAYQSAMYITEQMTGSLSDIAEKVVAIPLQDAGGRSIIKARNIRTDGDNLFLISENSLLLFNRKGEFIRGITHPEDMMVAGFLLDTSRRQLIVLANENDVFYYSYDGQLLERRTLDNTINGRRIQSLSLYADRIWSVEENMYLDPDTQETCIQKELVSYDQSFQKIQSFRIVPANVGRKNYYSTCFEPHMGVDPDTGGVYIYNPSLHTDYVLEDTLYISNNMQQQLYAAAAENTVPVFPVCSTGRFYLSAYHNTGGDMPDHLFYFDRVVNEFRLLTEGIKDDFYHTGNILNLESMDIRNQSYYFCKSGEETKKAFPERKNPENAVVFIVKLKA